VIQNLTAAGDCLVVTAGFVTLDLNGLAFMDGSTGTGISG
jgi:hypothetical protein